eukprot:scaffold127934_cov14-Tisochrysis_lutea.AAC.1
MYADEGNASARGRAVGRSYSFHQRASAFHQTPIPSPPRLQIEGEMRPFILPTYRLEPCLSG